MRKETIKDMVKKKYGSIATSGASCCGADSASCCGSESAEMLSKKAGYKKKDLQNIPQDANMGLGCGNPSAAASLKKGETVLDLGSGAGIDCFMAANKVGAKGRVIGVDMTPEMIKKAVANAKSGGYKNIEFRLGEIEAIPVEDGSVDVVLSNCVINLSTDKQKVFREIFRVLKPGGRFIISDIVLNKKLPPKIQKSAEYYAGCVAGAMLKKDYLASIKAAGFKKTEIVEEKKFDFYIPEKDPDKKQASMGIISLKVSGKKQ